MRSLSAPLEHGHTNGRENTTDSEKKRQKILVVDDDTDLTHCLRTWLTEAGFAVHIAQVGKAAIQFFNLYRPYALVLLDLHMPKIDGYQVLDAIRRADLKAHVAVLTEDTHGRDVACSLGADASLLKPFGRDAVIDLVKRLAS